MTKSSNKPNHQGREGGREKGKKELAKKLGVPESLLTATKRERDNCICAKWGEGRSTCGFPCPVHPPQAKGWEKEFHELWINFICFDHRTSISKRGEKRIRDFIKSIFEKV